jgi:hypothetical protein
MHTPFKPLRTALLILPLLTIFSLNAIGQVQSSSVTKETYFKKSKNQKTAAWILLGAGTGMLITGALIGEGNIIDENTSDLVTTEVNGGKYALIVGGMGSMLGSIPLFIASKRNKRKAMSMSFKNQNIRYINQGQFVTKLQPALTLKVNF